MVRFETAREFLPATGAFLLLYAMLGAPLAWRQEASGAAMLASTALAVALAALSAVDMRQHRLPDVLTLPLAALGLGVSWWAGVTPAWWPVASALVGYTLLAGLAYLYASVRGRAGLGLGDAKLLAASGAWLGAETLPTVLLWATGAALACVLVAYWRGHALSATTRIPFGPFLAFATWLVWLYGPL